MCGWMWEHRSRWRFSGRSRWMGAGLRWRGRGRRGQKYKQEQDQEPRTKSKAAGKSARSTLAELASLAGQPRRPSPHELSQAFTFHFRLNRALTWAVTVTVCGVNSSVGAGSALAAAAMARAMRGNGARWFSKV